MRLSYFITHGITAALFIVASPPALPAEPATPAPGSTSAFRENAGQIIDTRGRIRPDIRYSADAGGTRLYLLREGLSVVFMRLDHSESGEQAGPFRDDAGGVLHTYRMDIRFEAANPAPRIRAEEQAPGLANFYLAHCPDGVLGARQYRTIRYENVWNGIDAIFMLRDGRLKYEFHVHPGGNPADIRLRYDGAESMRIAGNGDFEASTPLGDLREQAPVSWQAGARGEREPVFSSFRLEGNALRFDVGAYETQRDLVIDPWATYFGGAGGERGAALAIDGNGNLLAVGSTNGTDYPVNNAQQNSSGGNWDATVAKFSSTGSVIWSTYYGGSAVESGYAVAVDANGNVAVAGRTYSANFPSHNAQQPALSGTGDAFLMQLNASGVRQWASFIGGSGGEEGFGVGVDASGNVYTCGRTYSTDFPTMNPHQPALAGGSGPDVFLCKYNGGGAMQWATFYGGTGDDFGWGMTVDGNGNVIVAGQTKSINFPVSGAFQSTHNGGNGDGFILKCTGNGVPLWATYYGGSGFDEWNNVASDANGNIALIGSTRSANFPVHNAQQNTLAGSADISVALFTPNGGRVWATYCGGPGSNDEDFGSAVVCDGSGNVIITGSSSSTGFPVMNAQQGGNNGAVDGVMAKYNSSGAKQWATYYGGSADEYLGDAAIGSGGVVFVVGYTYSTDIYVPGASQAANAGNADMLLAAFEQSGALPVELVSFTAEERDGVVLLRFRTAAETGNAGFIVERRADALPADWRAIGFIAAQGRDGGGGVYEYLDAPESLAPELVYRLKQIDADGSVQYSPELRIMLMDDTLTTNITMYPLPASTQVTVSWQARGVDISDLQLLDLSGRVLRQASVPAHGSITHRFDLSNIPVGVYQLRVHGGGQSLHRLLPITR